MQQHILDPWQKEALEHKGNLLLCTGRQVGKTFIMSRKAANYMIEHPKSRIIVVSLTEDQAKLIIIMTLDYLEKNHKQSIAKGKNKPTMGRIKLKNGSEILARPVGNTGAAVRGFTGDVLIVDEASRMPEMMWAAAEPTLLTTGGEIWMCSTPHGKEGYFWECYQNKDDYYKVIHISSEEVIKNREFSEEWTEDVQEKRLRFLDSRKKAMSEVKYAQEYLGQFMDELRRYFDDKWIMDTCNTKRPDSMPSKSKFYMGVDIARMGEDLGSYEIFNRITKDTLIQVENITTAKQLTWETEERIIDLDRRYNFKKIYIDAGAGTLGVSVLDHLLKIPQVSRKVIAINNAQRVYSKQWVKGKKVIRQTRLLKEDLYDNLRALGEQGKIKLLDDEDIVTSLRSIQFEYVKKDGAQSRLKIFGEETDIVEGIIRGAWCVKEKDININIYWV